MNFKKFFEKAANEGIEVSEVSSSRNKSFSFEIFKGELVSYTFDESRKVSARGILNDKMGFGITEKDDATTPDYLLKCIKESATLSETDDEAIIFKGSEKYHKRNTYSKELAIWPTEDKIAICHKIEERLIASDSRITDVEVAYSDSESEYQLANSYGLNLKNKSNYFFISANVIVKDGDEVKSDADLFIGDKPSEFKLEEFCDKIVNTAISKLHGTPAKNGKNKCVLNQESVASLLNALLSNVSSEQVQKHSSLFEGKLNEQVLSNKLTISERPLDKNIFFSYFDDEGVATYNKVIFDKGTLVTYFYNLNTAKKDGVQSTGNGARNGSKVGIAYGNIVVKPGRLTEEELFEKVNDGLYITGVQGLHAGLNATSGDFSLQAEGFHIENGKKAGPLSLFTVSGNLFQMFKDVIAVGNNSKLLTNSFTVPSIAFKNLKISAE